jgi:putative ABC transport system permease protein
MSRDLPRRDAPAGTLSDIIVAPKEWVVAQLPRALDERTGRIEDIDWPLEQNVRAILARRHGFDPLDKQAIAMWDTSLQTLMFGRMIGNMKTFFTVVGIVTLLLGGIGVMNIMLIAVKERTREIGVRKALGATTAAIQRQFFLEGFFLTLLSGGTGMAIALGLCRLVNMAPMPERFAGMILSWQSGLVALATLVAIGVVTSTYPARRAAELPPVEALRFEM